MQTLFEQLMADEEPLMTPPMTSAASPSDLITALMLDAPASPTLSLFDKQPLTSIQLDALFADDDDEPVATSPYAVPYYHGRYIVQCWGDLDNVKIDAGHLVTPGFCVTVRDQPSWKKPSALTVFTNTIVSYGGEVLEYQVTAEDAPGEVRTAKSSSGVYRPIKQDVAKLNGVTLKGKGAVDGPVKFGYGQPRIAEVLRTLTGFIGDQKPVKRAVKALSSSKKKSSSVDADDGMPPPFISRKKRIVDDLDNDEHVSMQYYMTRAWKEFASKDVVSLSEFRARVTDMMSDECVVGGGPVYAPSLSDIRDFVASRK
jgi:hypothetical protein